MTQHPYDYIHDYAYNSSLDRAKLRVQLPLRVEDYKGKLCIANKDINYCRHSIKKNGDSSKNEKQNDHMLQQSF